MRYFVFLSLMALVQGLGTALVYARWLRPPVWPFGAKPLLLSLLAFLWLALPLGHLAWSTFHQPWAGALNWLGYFWLGLLFYAACALALSGLLLRLLRLFFKPSLRLRQGFAAVSAAAVLAVCAYGAVVAARGPKVAVHEVHLPKLSPAFDGFRVAVVSDMHLGMPGLGRAFSEQVVDKINALEADVVALLGDLVDRDVDSLAHAIAPLQHLRAQHGVLLVTGNHEYFVSPAEWVQHFQSLGFRVLGNARVEIERAPEDADAPPARLAFAGVFDLMSHNRADIGHRMDLKAALHGWDAATPLVLLSHQPQLWDEARAAGVDLTLSGHTHGGQIWPFHYVVARATTYVQGLYKQGEAQLYVTTGAGQWGPPLRVGAPPEIALLRLRAPAH